MTEEPLWSERKGKDLGLTKDGFAKLVERLLISSTRDRLFEQVLGLTNVGIPRGQLKAHHNPAEFFTFRLGDPWAAELLELPGLAKYEDRRARVRPLSSRTPSGSTAGVAAVA